MEDLGLSVHQEYWSIALFLYMSLSVWGIKVISGSHNKFERIVSVSIAFKRVCPFAS